MSDKVVFLAHRNKETVEAFGPTQISCKLCHNRTWLIQADEEGKFPFVKCCACGQIAGRMGWAHDEP